MRRTGELTITALGLVGCVFAFVACESPRSTAGPRPADTGAADTTASDSGSSVPDGDRDSAPTADGIEVEDTVDWEELLDAGDTPLAPETNSSDRSALTGVYTDVSVTAPPRNPLCHDSSIDSRVHGARYPWAGLEVAGILYTCNRCPTGLETLQGRFRAHGYAEDNETPDFSEGGDAATGDADLLEVDGNTWHRKRYGPASRQLIESRGWFFCSQQPEHPNEHLFWVSTEVVAGPGAVGDTARSDVVLSAGRDRHLISWFAEVDGSLFYQSSYCRIGTAQNGKVCTDPFAP